MTETNFTTVNSSDPADFNRSTVNTSPVYGHGFTNESSSSSSEEEGGFLLVSSAFLVYINGYISPVLVLVTLVTNTLVCVVLMRPNMRSPTNVLLVAIASADMLTGVWPLPSFLYFYSAGFYRDWVPHDWCFVYSCMTDYLPTAFHTMSIWLTVALAGQRYVYVCHAIRARELCTVPKFVRVIVCVVVFALVSQFEYEPTELTSRIEASKSVVGCRLVMRPFVQRNINVYFNFYYWFRVVFIHLVPCTSLVVLNALLVNAMRSAQARREQLLKQNRRSESRRLAETNTTTMMLVHVVGVFLLVEFPLAVLLIIMIVQNTFSLELIDRNSGQIATWFINLFILFSYPVNFFIYCGMSRQFRATFKATFCFCVAKQSGGVAGGAAAAGDKENTQYLSLGVSGDNGGRTTHL